MLTDKQKDLLRELVNTEAIRYLRTPRERQEAFYDEDYHVQLLSIMAWLEGSDAN